MNETNLAHLFKRGFTRGVGSMSKLGKKVFLGDVIENKLKAENFIFWQNRRASQASA